MAAVFTHGQLGLGLGTQRYDSVQWVPASRDICFNTLFASLLKLVADQLKHNTFASCLLQLLPLILPCRPGPEASNQPAQQQGRRRGLPAQY
jgi:hypothetical protein